MIVRKSEVRTASKKLLSILLSVVLVVSSISVCFATISFAAGGSATDTEWNSLFSALGAESVKNASFSTVNGRYTVDDPDGAVLAAVTAYFDVFDKLANKEPATGNPNNTNKSYTAGSSEGNRVIQQVNASIKSHIEGMPGYQPYMGAFIEAIRNNATVDIGTGQEQEVDGGTTNDKSVPASNLADEAPISITVVSSSAVTNYTIDNLPENVVTEKTFTVKHANDRYDYKYAEGSTGGCNSKTTYTRYYKYYYYISGVTVTDGKAISTATIKNSQRILEANEEYFSYNLDQWVAKGFEDTSDITSIRSAVVSARSEVVNLFSTSIYNHFFPTYDTAALSQLVNKAVDIINASHIAISLNELIETGYASIITDKAALELLSQNVKIKADSYDSYAADVKAYVESHDYEGETFNRSAVTDFYNAILREIELIELRALKATIEATDFTVYTEENVTDGTVQENGTIVGSTITAADLTFVIGTVQGWIDAIGTYDSANVAEVWGDVDVVAVLEALKAKLEDLKTLAGYNDSFAAKYSQFIKEVYANTNLDADSADLLAAIEKYDSWYTGVKALIAEIEAAYNETVSDAVIEEHDAVMKEHLDSKYNALHARVLTQIDLAIEIYKVLEKDEFKVSVINLNTFAEFKTAFEAIDTAIYDFLLASANFAMPQETIDKYNSLKGVGLQEYLDFLATGGFAQYEQTEIDDIIRPEADDNHDAHQGDFTVTDEKVEKIIDLIERLLADDDIKALLGNLINKDEEGNPTGEPFTLGALVEGLLEDVVFTDSLINTIIQFVYPLVAKEFAKVWAGLPETMTIEDVDTGFMGIKADVTADLTLSSVEDAIAAVGVFLAPSTLAKNLENAYGKNSGEYAQYTEVISVLKSATTKAVYNLNGDGDEDDTFINPWEDANLFENVYDEETGEQVFNDDGTPKQVYKLNWGVDEAENKREAFINAACAALSGLEPLLFGILTNKTQANANDSDGVPRGAKIGTGSGSAKVIINLNLEIDPITLVIKFGGNDGYDNALAPIFEALGLENIPHGEDLTTTRKILEDGLFAMIDQLIEKLDTNPISFLLEALPNLAYALEVDLVAPLLGMLRTEINYYADAKYSVIGLINGNMPEAMKSEEPIIVDLGEMINLEDMGLDISSFSAIWDMLAGSVELLANMEAPNAGYIATLGELVWKDTNRSASTYIALQAGKAAHINANKADVLIYLLRYVLNALPGILNSIEDLELSDDIKAIIADATANPDKTIAAVVELLNAVEYDTLKSYVWYESELNADTVVGMTPAIHQYLDYDNNWTRNTAEYIIGNLDALISAVAGESFNLADTLSGLIEGLFTNKNITALARALSALDLNALISKEGEESELDVNALVNKLAGIDLSAFAAYKDISDDTAWGFEDGDKEGFVNALVSLLAPLEPVIDFILKGEDLTLLDDVTLIGYNGYDNAIVPLLEALGATPAALGEDDSAVAAVINALADTVASLDSVDAILDIIPGVLYFIRSNGLTTAVRNLLQPVYVILETIEPVYALELNALIGDLTKDMGISIDLNNLSLEAIIGILKAVTGLELAELGEILDDVCEVLGTDDYTSASAFVGQAKRGTYGEYFDKTDLITVVVSFALSWLQQGNNAQELVALIAGGDSEKEAQIKKYIVGAVSIINGIRPEYEKIEWDYNFPEGYEESIFESGLSIQPTLYSLTYPTNWTEETAKYIGDNLTAIVDDIIAATGSEYTTLTELLGSKVSIYTTENVDAIVTLVAGLLEDIDATLLKTIGTVLGADLDALTSYKAPEGIDTAEEFADAIADVLATIQPVIDWLFFGEDYAFFSNNGTDLITVKGTEGYGYGLAPILEALGVETPDMTVATAQSVLEAVFARVDEILASPVEKIFDILPNIIYFLNTNGVSVSLKNLLAGVNGLIAAVREAFGVELELMTIINDLVNGLLPEDTTVALDVADLELEDIFALVQELLGIDLTPVAHILVDLCVGKITAYKSASNEYGFKMQYNDDFARYDMITILVTVLLETVKLEENEEALSALLGEEIYNGILNVLSLRQNVEVQEFDWLYTDKADTDNIFSATISSELYEEHKYGPLFTEDKALFIAENFGDFANNIIYLLGININDEPVDDLTELLNGLVGGSVYSSSIIATLANALRSVASELDKLPAGAHIKAILKSALGVDLSAWNEYAVVEFSDDRAMFESELCRVLAPLFPVLKWLLADEDITFFVDEDREVLVTLPGAEGYAYGIIPLLETLGCKGLVSSADYNAAVAADDSVLITSIISPLLDRVDEILLAPADELLDILPNIIYFVNSNGVDTVVKNTLNAVYTLLNAIEPIAKVDLYELIGLDLATLDFEKLFDMLLELIAEQTGYSLDALDMNAIAELTTGKVESYTSANGKTAYRMVYAAEQGAGEKEMVTVTSRLAITFIMHENNREALLGILRDNLGMDADAEKYVKAIIDIIADCTVETSIGMDMALSTVYYLFYGADIGVDSTVSGIKNINAEWQQILKDLGMSDDPDEVSVGNLIADILEMDIFEDIISADGIAPNGILAFFTKIFDWMKSIFNWIGSLFK